MIRHYRISNTAVAEARNAIGTVQPEERDGFPGAVVDFLARLRLLEGVPFAYLVPHEPMLPPESIRFFYVNRNWTDAAVEGALSIGGVTSRDRRYLHTLYPELRNAVDSAEHKVRELALGNLGVEGEAEVITGFVLRSRAVSGWPGLHVRAYLTNGDDDVEMRALRIERLAPAVLLALFDGIPDRVEIEEPRQGIQFGVDESDAGEGAREITLRHPQTGEELTGLNSKVTVPFRRDAPGVIDVASLRDEIEKKLREEFDDDDPDIVGDGINSAGFALQMLQFPFRQEFGEPSGDEDGEFLFVTTIDMAIVRLSHQL